MISYPQDRMVSKTREQSSMYPGAALITDPILWTVGVVTSPTSASRSASIAGFSSNACRPLLVPPVRTMGFRPVTPPYALPKPQTNGPQSDVGITIARPGLTLASWTYPTNGSAQQLTASSDLLQDQPDLTISTLHTVTHREYSLRPGAGFQAAVP